MNYNSNANPLGTRIIPMLQKKLGGGWRSFVHFWTTADGKVHLRFHRIDAPRLADVQGALFHLARCCGFKVTSWQRGKRYSLQPA